MKIATAWDLCKAHLRDCSRWFYVKDERELTPLEISRAAGPSWPVAIDRYVYFNVSILVLCIWWADRTVYLNVLIALAACWGSLHIARKLWREPLWKHLNIFCYATGLGICLLEYCLYRAGYESNVLSQLPLVAAGTSVVVTAWWLLTIVRVEMIQSRLRELVHQAERESLAARLATAQIQPHFLFNTLAALQHWAASGDARAVPALKDFTVYLRATLTMFDQDLHRIDKEIELVRSYLAIMQARLGRRLDVEIEVQEPLSGLVPPGVILTLVENSIRHGIEPAITGGKIRIVAKSDSLTTVLEVSDNGVGLPDVVREGIGLTNVRQRLKGAFGSHAHLQLSAEAPGCLATLVLPSAVAFGSELNHRHT